jgi:hypothetical protein
MPNDEQPTKEGWSFVSLLLLIIGVAVALYLGGFASLVLIPGAAQATGLSPTTLEKIYYPIIRLLD